MSSTSSSYHIPFPRTWIAVNTPVQKSTTPANVLASPEPAAHGFLSNRSARHQSMSSVSSIGSITGISDAGTISAPSSPPTKAADSPVLGPTLFAPLAVNTKHAPPPQGSQEMSPVLKSPFLSNRH